MIEYSGCSESCCVFAFIYIDRFIQKNPSFTLTYRNMKNTILSSMILATKYLDDAYIDNIMYTKISEIGITEINSLESEMLKGLDYELYVEPELYSLYANELEFQWQRIQSENSHAHNGYRNEYEDHIITDSMIAETNNQNMMFIH